MRRHTLRQLTFEDARRPRGRGGWRPNAGRPRTSATVAHSSRAELAQRHPALVTWRLLDGLPSLRRDYLAVVVRQAIGASHKPTFGIVEFSIQTNHLHFLIEACGSIALARGLQGLAKRLALRMNGKLRRNGRVFASRYHVRALATPREVRHALRYVLLNTRHHLDPATPVDRYWVDPYSSGPWFDGWATLLHPFTRAAALSREPNPTVPARTWLLRTGWRRWGLLAFDERPGGDPVKRASRRRRST
jgi:REP element-mobilizing transposase RayT